MSKSAMIKAAQEKTRRAKELREAMLRCNKTILSYEDSKALFPRTSVQITFDYILVRSSEQSGRYAPQSFGYACQNPLRRDADGVIVSPIIFTPCPEVDTIFGIDFGGDGNTEVMIGAFHDDIVERERFFVPAASYSQVLTMPDILIRVNCTGNCPGKEASLARVLQAQLFESRTNNSGRRGKDYWVMSLSLAKADPEDVQVFRHKCAELAFPKREYSPDFLRQICQKKDLSA